MPFTIDLRCLGAADGYVKSLLGKCWVRVDHGVRCSTEYISAGGQRSELAFATKDHRPVAHTIGIYRFYSSWGQKAKTKVLAGLVPSKVYEERMQSLSLSLAYRWASPPRVFPWIPSVCVSALVAFSYKDTTPIG